jgi:signal transduction histidine kinase
MPSVLGLRISHTIVESHWRRLWAADKPPRGARFYFTQQKRATRMTPAGRSSHCVRL